MYNNQSVTAFKELLELADQLLGPEGCEWDKKQTLHSLRESLLEECYEVLEAIDLKDDANLIEELGDLFYNLIFLSKIGEKEQRFSLEQALQTVHQKLVRRHPHIFGEHRITDPDKILEQWNEIKKQEKKERTSVFDGIPKHLPSLARAYELASKGKCMSEGGFTHEQQLGEALWHLAKQGMASGLNPELALRNYLMDLEQQLRKEEAFQK